MAGRNGRQKGSGSKLPAVRMHPYRREPKVPPYSAHDIVEEPQKPPSKRQGSPSSDCSDDPLLLDSDGSNCEWLQIIPIRPPKQSASTPPLLPDAPVTPPAEEFIAPPAEAPASPPSPRPTRSIATSPSCSEAGFAAPAPIRPSFSETDDAPDSNPEDWYGWTPDPEEHINVAAAMVICRLFLTPREVAKQRLPSTPEDKLLKRRIEQEVVVPWLKKKQAASHLMPPRRRVSEPLTIICNGYSWESDDVVQTRRPERHMRLTAWDIINYGERNKEQGCWYHRFRCALPDQPEVKDNGSEYDYMLLFMKPTTVPEIWELWLRGRHEEQRRRKHPDWFWSGGFKTNKDRRRAWRRWKSGKVAVRSTKAGWAYSSNGTRQAVEVGPAPERSPSPDPVLQPRIMFDIILPPECRPAATERVHPPPRRASNPPGQRLEEAPVGPPSPPPSPAPEAEFSDPAPCPPADSARRARSPSLELEYLTPPPEQVPEAPTSQKDIPVLSINTDAVQRPDSSHTPPSPVSPSSSRGYRTPGPWPEMDVQANTTPAEEDHAMDTDPAPPQAAAPEPEPEPWTAPPVPSSAPFCTFARPPDAVALHAAILDAHARGLHTGVLNALTPGLPGPWLVLSADAQMLRACLEMPGRAMPGAFGRPMESARVVEGGWLEERESAESGAGCAQAVLAGAVGGLAVWCGLSML